MSREMSIKKSFGFAFSGLKLAFKTEPNFRIHTLIACLVVFLSFLLNLTSFEWFAILLTIAFVIVMELINTSLEAVVDLVSPEFHQKAKIAKDTAAGAVLISAFFAILIAVVILLPKIF